MTHNNLLVCLDKIAHINFQEETNPHLVIETHQTNQGKTFSVNYSNLPKVSGLIDRIIRFILELIGRIPKRDVDDLKNLKKLFKSVLHLQLSEEEKQTYRTLLVKCFKNIHQLYDQFRECQSIQAMALKNDLLEAVAVAVMEGGLNQQFNLDVQRIKADEIHPFFGKIKDKHIPIFRMCDLELVTDLMREKFNGEIPTLKQIQADPDLKKFLKIENVALGSIVRLMYKHRLVGKLLNNHCISGLVTKWMEYKTKKELKPGKKRTRTILKFFKKLHINPATAIDGKLYSYREMFQKSLRKEVSCDAAFQRGLNESMTKQLIESAKKETEIGLPVICNAFCRMRIIEIPENSVKTPFSIEGKILNNQNPAGFTIQNLLGNENNVDTQFTNTLGAVNPRNELEAEYLYQCCLTNAINRKRATLVIQRLAPMDIHHYVEPVGGKVLNREEACQKLIEMQELSTDEEEKKQLEILVDYFQTKDSEKGVVEVKGTRMSVSTLATKYRSPLSQNDRKILMVEHNDGSIAIHTFIGAISVNNVQVTAKSGEIEMGDDVGSMGFGNDENNRDSWKKMATKKESIRIRANANEQLNLGEQRGKFAKEGSTVVSLYFNFRPLKKIADAIETLQYKDADQTNRHIEIEARIGDPIGYLTPGID